ncbi:MAG: DUF3352 domain-containing protein [Cyanobacteria bacterium J06639_14]
MRWLTSPFPGCRQNCLLWRGFHSKVLPANTAYIIMLDMRDETWQQLAQYSLFQMIETQREAPMQPEGLPFLPVMDYATAIAPWVGDTTALALLPLESPRVTKFEDHEVLIAPIARPDAFEGFIETVTMLRETAPTTQVYQGLSMLYWEPQFLDSPLPEGAVEEPIAPPAESETPSVPSVKALPEEDPAIVVPETPEPDVPGLAIAVLPDLLIAAETPAAIRSWLDLRPVDEATSLAAQDRFQRTLAHPEYDGALGTFHGNLGEMVKYALADVTLPRLPTELPSLEGFSQEELGELAALGLDSSIEVLIYPQPQGIRLQGRGYYDDTILQVLQPFLQPASPAVLETVPDASYLMLSGQNIATAWQQAAIALETQAETAEVLDQARFFFQFLTGLDLDQEFFGWMDQGFAAFLFPTRQTPATLLFPELQVGLGIALQTSDRAAAEDAFTQLDETLGTTFVTVSPQVLPDQTASNWTIDFDADGKADESVLGHGWAREDTLVVTTSIGSLSEILNLATRRQLPSSPIFRRATQDFPSSNQGYVYSNLSAVRWLFTNFLPLGVADPLEPLEPVDSEFAAMQEALGTIQALSGTLSFTEEYLQLDGTLVLSPAE